MSRFSKKCKELHWKNSAKIMQTFGINLYDDFAKNAKITWRLPIFKHAESYPQGMSERELTEKLIVSSFLFFGNLFTLTDHNILRFSLESPLASGTNLIII
jgi:hypothetical protein